MLTPVTNAAAALTSTRTYPATREQVRADDIILCASELAANAAIHSSSARSSGTVTVHMTIDNGHCVRIEVRDDGGPWTQPPADADRPHGLDLVRALASGWGAEETAIGRIVWAQLDWPTA